jgi:hypothetical protein
MLPMYDIQAQDDAGRNAECLLSLVLCFKRFAWFDMNLPGQSI